MEVRRRHLAFLLVIALVGTLVYINTLGNALVYDDLELLTKNTLVRDPFDLGTIFGNSYWGETRDSNLYRPLTTWSFALNYRANILLGRPGVAPLGFHLLNVLLHGVVGCLLFLWLLKLDIPAWVGLSAALLFAAHPIHTEAVAGVVGRAELLATGWGLLFLILHRRRRLMPLAGVAYFLALCSKESAIAFIAVVFSMDLVFPHQQERWPVSAYAVYGLVLVTWLGLRAMVLRDSAGIIPFVDNPLVGASLAQRILTACKVQLAYLRLQLLPIGLSSDYSYNQIPIVTQVVDSGFWEFVLALLVVFGGAWAWRKKHPVVFFVVLGYAVLFAPTCNFIIMIGTIMGERLAYGPSLFFCLLLGYGIWHLKRRFGPTAEVGLAVLLVIWAGLTMARNGTWADELTFYRSQARSAPNSAKARYNLGTILAKLGDDQAAIEEYQKALQIFPYYSEPLYNKGNALRRLGAEPEQVIQAYRSAIQYDPGHRNARANLALFLLDLGRTGEAGVLVAELSRLAPQHSALGTLRAHLAYTTNTSGTSTVPAELQEGITLYVQGEYVGAIQHLQQALNAGSVPPPIRKTVLMMLVRSLEATGDSARAAAYRNQANALGATPGEQR